MKGAFVRLNDGWNAEPNAPEPSISFADSTLLLAFALNPYQYPGFHEGQRATLRFAECSRFRLGAPNDEGWYSKYHDAKDRAPWGEFYEIADASFGYDDGDWQAGPSRSTSDQRHFLFHLRDETFECLASDWSIEVGK